MPVSGSVIAAFCVCWWSSRVRQGQSDLAREEGRDLLLLRREDLAQVAAEPGHGADHIVAEDHRRGHRRERVRHPRLGDGPRVARALHVVVDDDRPQADRPTRDAFAGLDPLADHAAVAARDRGDDELAAGLVARHEHDHVARDDVAGPGGDLVIHCLRVEARDEDRRKRRQAVEQRRALGELLPLATQRQRRSQSVADDLHDREVVLVEAVLAARLDVQDAEELAVVEQGDADLADDIRIAGQELRVASRVRQECRLLGPRDPPEDAPIGCHGLDRETVVALRAQLEGEAVPDVDRWIAVAERALEHEHHAVEGRRGGALAGEQSADRFDRGQLARVPAIALVGPAEPERGPLERGHDASAADRHHDRGHREREHALACGGVEARQAERERASGPCRRSR